MPVELPTSAGDLCAYLGATLLGDPGAAVSRLVPLDEVGVGRLAFLSHGKLASSLDKLSGGVVLTRREWARPSPGVTFILVTDPKRAFAEIARGAEPGPYWEGLSARAEIHPSAEMGEGVAIGPFAVIGPGVRIGRGSRIDSHTILEQGVVMGEDCDIRSHVTIERGVVVGDRVQIFSGSVIGSEGFGFFEIDDSGKRAAIPQIGFVVLEDEVRVGANCTIDRATIGETRIGAGTKLDNMVHIGHNCRIGKNTVICAQVGIGGSTVVEDEVLIGGQAGLTDHVHVARGARVGAGAGVTANLKGGETYLLYPAVPMREAVKIVRYLRKLPSIWQRLGKLENPPEGL